MDTSPITSSSQGSSNDENLASPPSGENTSPSEKVTTNAPATQESPPPVKNAMTYIAKYGIFTAIVLALGIGGGYGISQLGNHAQKITLSNQEENVVKPPLALKKILTCADTSVGIYLRPQDSPEGPLYTVKEGKTLAITYLIAPETMTSTNTYPSPDILHQVTHITTAFLPRGYSLLPSPRYSITFSFVSTEKETQFHCSLPSLPTPPLSKEASSSSHMNVSISPSPTGQK